MKVTTFFKGIATVTVMLLIAVVALAIYTKPAPIEDVKPVEAQSTTIDDTKEVVEEEVDLQEKLERLTREAKDADQEFIQLNREIVAVAFLSGDLDSAEEAAMMILKIESEDEYALNILAAIKEMRESSSDEALVKEAVIAPAKIDVDAYQQIIDYVAKESGNVVEVHQLEVFEAVGNKHGVPWKILISQWYQETECSRNMGSSNPLTVLAGNTAQLNALDKICTNLGVDPNQIKSGRAGELGPMQFRPTIWLAYGKDLDGDEIADPWDLAEAADACARFLTDKEGGCGFPDRNALYGALAHYNGGYNRSGPEESPSPNVIYANEVYWRVVDYWGGILDS